MKDFRDQVEKERAYLLRYARLQLRDSAAAEDAVQEALVAALAGEKSFGGRSNLRTWLTGILKHKIIDTIRKGGRETQIESDEALEALFNESDHWKAFPPEWDNPDRSLEQKQFFAALEMCLEGLPEKTARVFLMREHMGLETDEICKELRVTPTHVWVLLYRARMALRKCLEMNWFGK